MTALYASRTEPITIRRGFEFRYRIQLLVLDSDGNPVPQDLTGFTITPQLRLTESKDAAAISGLTPTIVTVSSSAGQFDFVVSASESQSVMVVGKTYYWMVFVNHATITNGKDELVRIGLVKVVA